MKTKYLELLLNKKRHKQNKIYYDLCANILFIFRHYNVYLRVTSDYHKQLGLAKTSLYFICWFKIDLLDNQTTCFEIISWFSIFKSKKKI